MAIAVLVEFDSDEKAKAFVTRVNGGYHAVDCDEDGSYSSTPIRVVGAWKLPTKFCNCAEVGRKMDIKAYVRGEKYGWWIHSCGRPSKFWVKARFRLWDALGRNILPGAEDPEVDPQEAQDHDNLMRDDLEAVGMALLPERARKRKKRDRPRRGDGSVPGH